MDRPPRRAAPPSGMPAGRELPAVIKNRNYPQPVKHPKPTALPYEVWWSTHVVLIQMCHDAAAADKAWERMVQQMRDDLGAKGAWRPTPEPEATSS